ncbi:MAG: ABC transporter permease subunit [Holosporales bacterium]|jgi:putrescine transport system permease protein
MHSRNPFSVFLLMILGYVFLYAPIFFVIFFSFNSSTVMTRFEGFSLRWYQSLFENKELWGAVAVSLRVAMISATLSVVLGTLCALTLVRLKDFKRRNLLGIMATAPLIMPEVITGLALLVFFVTTENFFGLPSGRGVETITIAHTTLCLAYVTVIIRGRLLEVDSSLEEAALDLGAKPSQVFFLITLPIISPALFSGWLLAFALSMDDLVIASFTSGPGSSTLPMVIFSSIRLGATPEINALATLIVLIVSLFVVTAALLMRKGQPKRIF